MNSIYHDLTTYGGIQPVAAVRAATQHLTQLAKLWHRLADDVSHRGSPAQRRALESGALKWTDVQRDHDRRDEYLRLQFQTVAMTLTDNLIEAERGVITIRLSNDPFRHTVTVYVPNGYKNGWAEGYTICRNKYN